MDNLFNINEINKKTDLFKVNKPESYELFIKDELYEDNKIPINKGNLYIDPKVSKGLDILLGGCDFKSQLPELIRYIGDEFKHDTNYSVSISNSIGKFIKRNTTDILIRRSKVLIPSRKDTAQLLIFLSEEDINNHRGESISDISIKKGNQIIKRLSLRTPIIINDKEQMGFFRMNKNWRIISLVLNNNDL